jgi:phosphoglycolate phosphatase
MMRGIFVTGTDTGVGKTFACRALLHALAARGIAALPMKPIAAGAIHIDGAWENGDTHGLREACGLDASWRERITPVLLREALAPHVAARHEARDITLDPVMAAFRELAATGRYLVVEGVGGFRVPLAERLDTVDLARALALPVVLVVGLRLGCLNHALLTAQAVRSAGLPLAGWIQCHRSGHGGRGRERRGAARTARGPVAGAHPLAARGRCAGRRARAGLAGYRLMRTLLFDLDGTLTDPREGITRSIAHALERMGIEPPPLDRLTFAIGPPLRASLAQLIGTEARDAVERALAHYRERFADVGLFENAVYDGIPEALAHLRGAGSRLLVATSKPRVYAERIVRHFGLDGHFDAVEGCELDGTREDKRDLLAHMFAAHAIEPGAAAMIGDRGHDMRAARHHGVAALGALWGYGSAEELREHGAHDLCETPLKLADALHRLASRAPS